MNTDSDSDLDWQAEVLELRKEVLFRILKSSHPDCQRDEVNKLVDARLTDEAIFRHFLPHLSLLSRLMRFFR